MRRLLVLLVLALLVLPGPASARTTSTSVEDTLVEIGVDWDSWVVKSYLADVTSPDTPYAFSFIGIDLATDQDAADVIDRLPPVFEQSIVDGSSSSSISFGRVSAGKVGDARYAGSGELETPQITYKVGYVMASSGHYVVIGYVVGILISPVVEVAPYVESTLQRLAAEEPDTSQSVRALLPQLDDMPAGYIDADDATPPAPSPTPQVISTPKPKSTSIHLAGNGNSESANHPLNYDYYRVTFTCAAPTGSVEIRWGDSGSTTVLETSTEHPQALELYTLGRNTTASVTVVCDAVWAFDVMPI